MPDAKIPNLNTVSTFFDRWIIEHVKLVKFEENLNNSEILKSIKSKINNHISDRESIIEYIDYLIEENKSSLDKVLTQREIINALKVEFEETLHEVFTKKHYKFIAEERTFKL